MLEGFKILAVDDDEMSLEMLSSILTGQGVQCTTAANGREALDALESNPDFEIVLLDLQMPVMNGFEVISQCKCNPYLNSIPIIVLASDRDEKLTALKLGADDFMDKPYDPEELEIRVSKLVQSFRVSQSARRAKNEFLAIASHELRTPLYHIKGLAELLQSESPATEQHEILELLKHAAGSLTNIVRNIMNYVQLDHGAAVASFEPFSLRASMQSVLDAHRHAAEEKGLVLQLAIDAGVSDALNGPSYYIYKIFSILIDNAIKFSSCGAVRITIREASLGTGHSCFCCQVCDDGIGIPLDFHEKIFEPFVQVDSSPTRTYNGLGLGLSIARRMVELMNGTIYVKNDTESGSTIEFSFHCDLQG